MCPVCIYIQLFVYVLFKYANIFSCNIIRYGNFDDILNRMNEHEDGIKNMALGHKYFGCHVNADNSFVIRQWAPGITLIKHLKKFRQIDLFHLTSFLPWSF